MRLTCIEARDFLGFHELSLRDLPSALSVVVGPNGGGKSSLRRTLDLLDRAVMWSSRSDSDSQERLNLYASAVRLGADEPRYWVRAGMELTELDERELVITWLRLAVLSAALRDQAYRVSLELVDRYLLETIDEEVCAPLFSGALVVTYEGSPYARFTVGYEFQFEGETYSLILPGHGPEGIVRGKLAQMSEFPSSGPRPIGLLFPDVEEALEVSENAQPSFSFARMLPDHNQITHLAAQIHNHLEETQVSRRAMRDLGLPRQGQHGLDVVFAGLLRSLVLVSDERVAPRGRYHSNELFMRSWHGRDSDVVAELACLQNGTSSEQKRLDKVRECFRALTGVDFELRMRRAAPLPNQAVAEEPRFEIQVDVIDGERAIPIELSGAGRWEALVLSTALAVGHGRVIILDEPAMSLHPTLQRSLLRQIQQSQAQTLLITHSPFLVPADSPQDLERIIRVDRVEDRSVVCRLGASGTDSSKRRAKLQQLISGSSDVRGLLFARAVILLEGESDFGALEHWLAADASEAQPAPHELNIVLAYVGGDTAFRGFAEFLDEFRIPWVIVCDGPVLSPKYAHSLCKQISRAVKDERPANAEDFAAWRSYWAKYGVYTLAESFDEEIEDVFCRVDPEAAKQCRSEFGHSKIRAGRAFAERSVAPLSVQEIYRSALEQFGLVQIDNA